MPAVITPPKDGERILLCSHAEITDDLVGNLPGCFHWYYLCDEQGSVMEAIKEDGTSISFSWMALCEACHTANVTEGHNRFRVEAGQPVRYAARDAKWSGPPPHIERIQ